MRNNKAFTLVEILIVVMILAILAVIALPRFSNASATARANMLADNLRVIRSQLMVYKAQHRGMPAGYPANGGPPSEAVLVAQMTAVSTEAGDTAAIGTPGYRYGPYLRDIPINPVNGLSGVRVYGDGEALPEAATGLQGWLYHPESGEFRSDATGADEFGKPYYQY